VLPNAVAALRDLGWIPAPYCRNDEIADAVVELVERAIALRLRPR
jgi:hypothetical protein